jgi:hypothetical protein
MNDKKRRNCDWFRANLADLLSNPLLRRKYAVICEEKVQAIFDTAEAALQYGVRHFSLHDFIIQQIISHAEATNFVYAAVTGE